MARKDHTWHLRAYYDGRIVDNDKGDGVTGHEALCEIVEWALTEMREHHRQDAAWIVLLTKKLQQAHDAAEGR